MTRKKRGGKEHPVGDLIEQLLASKGFTTQLKKYQTWSCWNDVVGPQIARHAQPLRIRDRILEVRVAQAAWMQQLQLLKPRILKQLNERLDGDLLDDIFLKRGDVTPPEVAPISQPKTIKPLTNDDRSHINDILAKVDDPDLHESLASLIGMDLQSKKTDKDSEQ
jgi:hypothetical protein